MHYKKDDILGLRRCTKCILPETYPNIFFDSAGVCNFCNEHRPYIYRGEEALVKEFEKYRNTGEKYDCLVGLSGGKDSTYTLYETVKKHKMRVIAFHFDNGTTPDGSFDNVDKAVKKLGVPLITMGFDDKIRQEIFKSNFNTWKRNPEPGMIPMWCIGCNQGYRLGAFKAAKEHRIPLLIAGSTTIENSTFKTDLLKGDSGLFFNYFTGLIKSPNYLTPRFLHKTIIDNLLRMKPTWVNKYYKDDVRLISYFSWIKYDEKKILKTIKEEMDWNPGGGTSTSRIDCMIGLMRDYFYNFMLGFAENDVKHSNMIREGMLDRSEAMERLKKRQESVDYDFSTMINFLAKYGLDKDVDKIINN